LSIRGVKTKIACNVSFLLLISAIITNVLTVVLIQVVWVRSEILQHHYFIEAIGQLFLSSEQIPAVDITGDVQHSDIDDLVKKWAIPAICITDTHGHNFIRIADKHYNPKTILAVVDKAVEANHEQKKYLDYGRSVFWWHPQAVIIATPLVSYHHTVGAVGAVIKLSPVYTKLRRYNHPVLIFIVLNTAILTIVGLYRIFRIYLRPIDRIIKQAEKYNEDDNALFFFRREDNELNRLSIALNHMLNRIAGDKKKLQSAVASLESANLQLKRTQDEVIRAEKLASVGRLASGIAHEIGNPIGIVLGYLDLLRQSDLSENEKIDFLTRTEQEIQRINTVIRQLLNLARPKETKRFAVSVHTILDELIEVIRLQPMMKNIRIEALLDASTDTVWANAEQLRQVFLNLLLNSADAIGSRNEKSDGTIRIVTENETDESRHETMWLTITVHDDGYGIEPQVLETIFDPFFTTKDPGKGTGLGLAVSYTIIEQMGGRISVSSQIGKGTAFTIRLSTSSRVAAAG
jgi:two-component system, NtrC family, sensor kinase